MRVVFMGTPEFAVPTLRALLDRHEVSLVVSRPDRPAGRGLSLRRSPVAELADAEGVPLDLPAGGLRDPETIARISAAHPEVVVVAAYGRILPPALLQAAPRGAINVHASLLPRWRGASPITAAILAGDTETGVSIMRMEEGLDTGPVLLQRRTPIGPDETTGELTARLAELGAEALIEGLDLVESGDAVFTPQVEDGVTLAPPVRKSDGDLSWDLSAAEIERAVRAFSPWPGVRLPLGGDPVRVLRARALPSWTLDGPQRSPGEVAEVGAGGIAVMAGDGLVLLEDIQAPGKKAMAAADYARGRRDLGVGGG
jgi:methionyl-tRNA formyltransferase